MEDVNPATLKGPQNLLSISANGASESDFQIAAHQTPGLSRHGTFDVGCEQSDPDQRADSQCNAEKEIQEMSPRRAGLPPCHRHDERHSQSL
jgi:hypothetical protein